LDSYSYRVETPDGTLYIFIDVDSKKEPVMIHANAGKTGNSLAAWAAGTCLLINELLEHGTSIQRVIQLLSSITTAQYRTIGNGTKIFAGPHAIQHALIRFISDRSKGLLED
jgi:hypothetical protein